MRRGCEHEKLVDEALRTLLLCKLEQQQDTMVHDHHASPTMTSNSAPNVSTTPITDWAATATAPRSTTISRMRHCAPAGRKAIMSITINGVKPGTATLTIRAGTQSVDAPVTVREHL